MRDERAMAASINASYSRPERFKPSCGTSDPGIMQVRHVATIKNRIKSLFIHKLYKPACIVSSMTSLCHPAGIISNYPVSTFHILLKNQLSSILRDRDQEDEYSGNVTYFNRY